MISKKSIPVWHKVRVMYDFREGFAVSARKTMQKSYIRAYLCQNSLPLNLNGHGGSAVGTCYSYPDARDTDEEMFGSIQYFMIEDGSAKTITSKKEVSSSDDGFLIIDGYIYYWDVDMNTYEQKIMRDNLLGV